MARSVGVTMALFDDTFLTMVRRGLEDHARTLDDVSLRIEDAQNDVGRQLSQIRGFIAAGVDAIIVNPVDTGATQAMTDAAAAGGVPLVYVNREPANVESLPANQAVVASDERESGTLQTREVCRLLREAGKGDGAKILVITGELSNQSAQQRTRDIHEVIATPECGFMEIVDEQAGNWSRGQGADLMSGWLADGVEFDAVVSNNDEMALGAIEAMKAAGGPAPGVLVAGVDATRDALAAMAAGDLAVTVFQDAAGQGRGALDMALKLARGENAERKVYIPFRLVTPANRAEFEERN
jgi:inositol transport system substrate-binding protein